MRTAFNILFGYILIRLLPILLAIVTVWILSSINPNYRG